MTIISRKQTLATVNPLKVVEMYLEVLPQIWKIYFAPPPYHNQMVSPIEYLFYFNSVQDIVAFM